MPCYTTLNGKDKERLGIVIKANMDGAYLSAYTVVVVPVFSILGFFPDL